ncbi:RhuM family protein [Hydrotalea sp.]|uniref:RhuM family protein n=1 Tax=Hydrotalea sp. TaxID=2881279 RepID=UPI0026389737|nr:RhuM family protein [Hydrotalea sp.]
MSEIILYKASDQSPQIEITFEGDTFWLSLNDIAELFQRDKSVISRHIKNILEEGELSENQIFRTVAKNAMVQIEGKRSVKRKITYYSLDVILAVGYRVSSVKGTQFRIWATRRLNEYLTKGYTINQRRLDELGKMVQLIEQSGKAETLQLQEAKGLLEILSNYTKSFVLLNQYDSHSVQSGKLSENITYEIQYDEAKTAISELKRQLIAKKEATALFGNEKDDSFKSSLRSIVQTFSGHYLYPSIEEQAAHLLYFTIKNHSFTDGNKRIGAFLFIWFLDKNKHRFKSSGEVKINDNGLTAIALLVAQSKPEEKEIIIQLIVALIADSK